MKIIENNETNDGKLIILIFFNSQSNGIALKMKWMKDKGWNQLNQFFIEERIRMIINIKIIV